MGALSDRAVSEFVNEKLIGTYEKVGSFRVSNSLAAVKKRGRTKHKPWVTKQGGNVVTYFCTPEREVIHFVVGPVKPKELLAEAKWAVETYEKLSKDNSGKQLAGKLQAAHAAVLSAQTRNNFGLACLRAGAPDGEEMSDASRRAIIRASVPLGLQMIQQFVAQRKDIALLRQQQHRHHMVLSRLAMVRLIDIEQPVFEVLAAQPYGRRTTRQEEALTIARNCIEKKQPLLIVINHQRQQLGVAPDEFDARSALPKHRGVVKNLDSYKIMALSYNEANSLADDLGQTALPRLTSVHSRAEFVFLDKTAQRTATVLKTSAGYYIVFDGADINRPFFRKLGAALSQAMQGRPQHEDAKRGVAAPGHRLFRSRNGDYSVYARYRGAVGDSVQLSTSDGRKITVALDQLSKADQSYLRRVMKSAARNKERLKTIVVAQED